ncbi:hypothetical protein [Flavobacterium sp. N1994]|uniref:hypothetical protein n=1 Tax=Flavobacterium sp. N1994 TaxID=2986827 RepID=UPI002222DB0D|nr:hypothetical protein [Flavobacterium sp. N1994]
MNRICIYNKDVQQITGKSERHCRDVIKKIRAFKAKPKHQPITIDELCDYLGLEVEKVMQLLR